MTIKRKFTIISLLLLGALSSLVFGWYSSMLTNERYFNSLKEEKLLHLQLGRTAKIKLGTFNHYVETALSTGEPTIVEDNDNLIEAVKSSIDTLASTNWDFRPSSPKELKKRLTEFSKLSYKLAVEMSSGSLGGNSFSQDRIATLITPLRENRLFLEKTIDSTANATEQEFLKTLDEIKEYNAKTALIKVMIFSGISLVIFGAVIFPLMGLVRRIRSLSDHFVATDIDSLTTFDSKNTSKDEINVLIESSNNMLEKLQESRKELIGKDFVENIFRSMSEFLFITNEKGSISKMNDSCLQSLGYFEYELLDMQLTEIVLKDGADKREELTEKDRFESFTDFLEFNESGHAEAVLLPKDGALKTVAISVSIIDEDESGAPSYVCVASDLSDIKKSQKEKDQLQGQLIQAAKLAALGTLGAGVAHELLNPLTGINSFSELISENPKSPDSVKKLAARINKLAKRMTTIVNHLRNFTRDTKDADWGDIDITEPANDSLILLDHQLKSNNIELVMNIEENLPKIKGDKNQVESIFQNLITNSRDAFAEISDDRTKLIKISITTESNNTLVLDYRDNAGGIPAEVLEKIFDPFFTTKEVGKGTGLGMSLCHQITERHGGTLTVDSTTGEGTHFRISFPISVGSSNEAAA